MKRLFCMILLSLGLLPLVQAGQCDDGRCQCVHYVQEHGYPDFVGAGNAYEWWGKAPGKFHGRGAEPLVGAVLVWKPWSTNKAGHVALVSSIISATEIKVDHANWPMEGETQSELIHTGIKVKDESGGNWTKVKVQWTASGTYGSATYDTYGFIYPVCKRGDGSCTMNRVGSIAWYPAISKCSNASQWFYVNNSDPITLRIGPSGPMLCPENCPAN